MALISEMRKASGTGYGKRPDGSEKGSGYFGEIKRPDGGISTELSTDVEIDGKKYLIPTLVPTLSRNEVNHLISGAPPTKEILDKAVRFSFDRMRQGKSPFAQKGEQVPLPREEK